MKIALVTPYDYPYPGGVTEHIRALDREFRSRSHDTRILAPSSTPTDELAPNVIPVTGEVLPLPFNGSTARISLSPQILGRVSEILERERFDVIHLHEPAAPLLTWSVLSASQAVTVGTFHAYIQDPSWNSTLQPLREGIFQALDGRILVSPALRASFPGHALAGPEGYRVIPNGIDVARFAAADIQPIPELADGRPNLLFVGRLEPRKGLPVLLQAFPQIQRGVPDARLIVVGAFGEEEKQELQAELDRRGIHGVSLVGRVSPAELPRYFRSAALFCAPSLGGESFGIVLLEAMAAGLPLVASRIAGYQSVMQDGREGLLVPPNDPTALANAAIRLLRDGNERNQMARRGRATAAGYDWSLVAPRILDYYQELLRARASSPVRRSNPFRADREVHARIPALPAGEHARIRMDIKGLIHWDLSLTTK